MQRTYRLGKARVWVSLRLVDDHKGMCSELGDGKHILMWDFDDTFFGQVSSRLRQIQKAYCLPEITILETKQGTNFAAFCFEALEWEEALAIVLDTPGVCWNYFRLSVIRGYFTIRYSPKRGVEPHFRALLPGKAPAKVTVNDLVHAMAYETSRG